MQEKCDKPGLCTSNLIENSLRLKGLIKGSHIGGQSLKFTVGPLKLYYATKILKEQFRFVTYMKSKISSDPESIFVVDSGDATPPIEMTPGGFKKITISTTSD